MKLLTRKELCEILSCSEQTIKHYVYTKQIPYVMVGKEAKFIEKSIYEWLEKRQVAPTFDLTKGI